MHTPNPKLRNLWIRLTEPSPAISKIGLRRRCRLILSMLVIVFLLGAAFLVSLPAQLALEGDPVRQRMLKTLFPLLDAALLFCLSIAYALGRSGRYLISARIVTGIALVVSYASIVVTGEHDQLATLFICVVLAGILLSWPETLAILALCVAGILATPLLLHEFSLPNLYVSLIILVVTGTLCTVSAAITGRDLRQIDEQTRELVENHEKLLGTRKMEAVARLSAGIAHEFNNIMMVIVGYSQLVATKPAESAGRYSRLITAAALRAGRLTDQLLAFGRQQLIHPKPTDLNQLIAGLEENLRSLAGDKIELTMELEPQPAVANVDPDLVREAVQALTRRAAKNIPDAGRITIHTESMTFPQVGDETARMPGACCAITIRDTGPPWDKDVLAQIFEPFFTEGEFGTGDLELAAAYGIINQSDGRIDVRSDAEHGNSFVVLLPKMHTSLEPIANGQQPGR